MGLSVCGADSESRRICPTDGNEFADEINGSTPLSKWTWAKEQWGASTQDTEWAVAVVVVKSRGSGARVGAPENLPHWAVGCRPPAARRSIDPDRRPSMPLCCYAAASTVTAMFSILASSGPQWSRAPAQIFPFMP